MDLIDRAKRYVEKMPAAVSGSGGHNMTFHAACILVQGFGLSPDQAWPILSDYNLRCAPPWSDKELRHKLKGADKQISRRGRGWLEKGAEWTPSQDWRDYHKLPEPPKVSFAAEKLCKFSGDWAKRVNLIWLANRSAFDPATVGAGRFLELLYAPEEKVCIFTREYAHTIGDGLTMWKVGREKEEGKNEEIPVDGCAKRPCGVWFFAQPVDGGYHPADEGGKMSCRNHRAVTAWRYLVIESDQANTKQWLGALAQLPLRISAIYSSGGRSVHALVRLDAPTKAAWDAEAAKMKPALTVLGADPKTLTAVRLTRLPGCYRHGRMIDDPAGRKTAAGKVMKIYERFPEPRLQKLLYINPAAPLAPLVDLFNRRDVEQHWCAQASAGVADTDETGGEWIERALDYYAGVSSDVYAARAEWRGEA